MKAPRDVSGELLGKSLAVLGYRLTRQSGSHMRFTTQVAGEHHITIPAHDPLKVGTLNSILREIERHHSIDRRDLLRLLFG